MRKLLFAAAMVSALACVPPDTTPPANVIVRCGGDEDCQQGEICSAVLSQCVDATTVNRVPPELLTKTLEPTNARREDVLKVSLEANEPLLMTPRVFLVLGEEERVPFDAQPAEGTLWRFTLTPAGSEPQDRDLRVVAQLVSQAGVATGDLDLGTVRFDFRPPSIIDGSTQLAPRAVRPGGVVQLSFGATEPVQATLFAGEEKLGETSSSGEGHAVQFSWTVPEDAQNGPRELFVELADRVGHRTISPLLGVVRVDSVPPSFTHVRLTPGPLRPGDLLDVDLEFDEALAGEVRLEARLGVLTFAMARTDSPSAELVRFFLQIEEQMEGELELVVARAADEAGNEVTGHPVAGTVRVDATAPGLRGGVLLPGTRWLRSGSTLLAEFEPDEEALASVTLEFSNGVSVPLGLDSHIGGVSRWRLSVDDDTPEGDGQVAVRLLDEAGNIGGPFLSPLVAIDRTPPQVLDTERSPALAGVDATVGVRLAANESLAGARQVELDRALLTFSSARIAGDTATLSAFVPEGLGTRDGEAAFVLVDLAGNESLVPHVVTLSVDTDRPQVAGATILPERPVRAGDTVEVELDVTEPLAQPPDVLLADEPFEAAPPLTRAFAARRVLSLAEDAEGQQPLRAVLRDAAGNESVVTLGTVLVDHTPPALVEGSFGVALEPPEGTPMRAVTSAREGTRIRVSFALSEPVRTEGVVVRGERGDTSLSFDCAPPAGTLWVCVAVVPSGGGLDEGDWTLAVEATDLAGNPASLAFEAAFHVDVTPPSAPDTTVAGRFLYRRVPWGATSTGARSVFELVDEAREESPASQAVVEPGTTVLVYGAAAADPLSYVGSQRADESGHFTPIALDRTDRARIWVALADGAGNLSSLSPVRDVEWTVSPGEGEGGVGANPTTLNGTCQWWPTLRQSGADSTPLALGPAASPDAAHATQNVCASWREHVLNTQRPTPRVGHTFTLDAMRGKAYLFGGWTQRGPQGDLWILDLPTMRWSRFEGQRGPLVYNHVAALDPRTGTLVVYGGTSAADVTSHVYGTWNPDAGRWTISEMPVGNGRGEDLLLDNATGAWDPHRNELVVFTERGLLLSIDPVTPVVTVLDPLKLPAQPWPVARRDAASVYDPDRGKLVLYGGRTQDGTVLADRWEWDFVTRAWTNRTPASPPPGRFTHALVYDPSRRKVISLGGLSSVGDETSDVVHASKYVVEWDPATGVTGATEVAQRPSARVLGEIAVWNPLTRRVLLFGGGQPPSRFDDYPLESPTMRDDFWQLDPERSVLVERIPEGGDLPWPADRLTHAMGYDPAVRRVAMHGGVEEWDGVPFAETWEFEPESSRWFYRGTGGITGDWDHHIVWDAARSKRMLVAADGGTWHWSGSAWQNVSTTGPKEIRVGRSAVYATGLNRLVLLGGFLATSPLPLPPTETQYEEQCFPYVGCYLVPVRIDAFFEAWRLWNGAWTKTRFTDPVSRMYHQAAWDPDAQRVFMFGGGSVVPEPEIHGDSATYEPASNTWARPVFNQLPVRRWGHAMTWDSARRKILSLGGISTGASAARREMWEIDVTDRIGKMVADRDLPVRSHTGLAYDTHLERAFVFGGTSSANLANWEAEGTGAVSPLGDLWEWNGGANERAAVLWTVPWSAAGAGASFELVSLALHARAGGRGSTKARPTTIIEGARLVAWDTPSLSWRELASNSATRQTKAPLDWSTSEVFEATRLFSGADSSKTLTIGLVAVGAAGAMHDHDRNAGVDVDALEVVVRYRLAP